jgi:hypothetical protein
MLTKHALRPLLVALAALALGASSAVALPGADADATSDATQAAIDLTGLSDNTTTVQASSLPAASTGIGPGSPLRIEILDEGTFGCTASWVFADGADLLLGAAGHCFLPLDVATTHGAGATDYDLSRTKVSVCVAGCDFGGISTFLNGDYVELGPLVYARQESAGGRQIGWDFGVVEIPGGFQDLVRTTMPVFGGPSTDVAMRSGDQVCHYGNGVGVGEAFLTKARSGLGVLGEPDAWFAATAAAPGDSGSALQTCVTTADGIVGDGAVGTLTHLTTLGVAGTTNARSIQLAATDAGLSLALVLDAVPATGSGSTDDGDKGGKGKGKGGDAPRKGPRG